MKKFKSLASTHIRKIAILLVISTLSSTILCSCGDDKNSTQIETMNEDETETTTQKPEETTTQKPEETTTQKSDEVKDEKTERQNQDADPTEATTTQSDDAKPSTQPTTQATEPTTQAHVHNFKPETYYTTETKTVHHDAKTHIVHHDAVTHQETTYKTETIERGGYRCWDGAFFESEADAARYADEHLLGYCSWKQTETVQVPYTETVVDQAAYDETVVDQEAYDETVEVQVAHTRNVCSCGATK